MPVTPVPRTAQVFLLPREEKTKMKRFGHGLFTLLFAFVFVWGLTGCTAQNGAEVNSPV